MPSLHNDEMHKEASSRIVDNDVIVQLEQRIAQLQRDAHFMVWMKIGYWFVLFVAVCTTGRILYELVQSTHFLEVIASCAMLTTVVVILVKAIKKQPSPLMQAEYNALRAAQEHIEMPWFVRLVNNIVP